MSRAFGIDGYGQVSSFPILKINQPLLAGAHIRVWRPLGPFAGYYHHGVYVGTGVVHVSGPRADKSGEIAVRFTTLEAFADGGTIEVVSHPQGTYSPKEIVERAVQALGPFDYSLTRNNCESFANEIVAGKRLSRQVEAVKVAIVGVAVGATIGVGIVAMVKALSKPA